MVQRVEYAVFTDVREQELLGVANKIIGHIHRSKPTFKEFREWLREEGLWDKEIAPQALDLLDVRLDNKKKVSLGTWAKAFFAADGLEAQSEQLFARMLAVNTLLVKYVLEALDMEGGGRLHSTYELHRMLTSYVYPGESIGLPEFQAWIKWMVAAGYLKLIGIRWGLTENGKLAVPRMRMIDVDEFLEDEAEEAEEEDEDEEDEERDEAQVEAAPVVPPTAAPTAAAAAAEVTAAQAAPPPAKGKPSAKRAAAPAKAEEAPEELPDMPPEAPPVDEAVFARYEADMVEEEAPAAAAPKGSEAPSAPSVPRRRVRPATVVSQRAIEVGCNREPLDMPTVINDLRAYGRERQLRGGSLLLANGLENRMAENEAARHLFLAALLARLYTARPDGLYAALLTERVGALTPVAILLDRPEVLAEVVVRWGFSHPDRASGAVRAALLDAVIGGRTLKAKADMPTILAEAVTSEVLVGMLSQGLLRGADPLAAFWLAREMVRAGLWTHAAATEIAFIPTRANRLMAYRLQMLDTHFAQGTSRLIDAARAMTRLLPAGSVEALAFDDLAPSDHLRFDCRQVEICQSPCGLNEEN